MDKPCTDLQVVALTERISALDRFLAEKFTALDKLEIAQKAALKLALEHQAEIYEQRLQGLNNVTAKREQQMVDDRNKYAEVGRLERLQDIVIRIDKEYMPMPVHEAYLKGVDERFKNVESYGGRLLAIEGLLTTIKTITIALMISAILFISGFVWSLLTHKIVIGP